MGLYYPLNQDRFYVTVKIKSLITNSMVKVQMLYDTGAQVSTLSRNVLEDLELYTLIEQKENDKVKKLTSHSGKIGVASGSVHDTYKIHIPSIELIDDKKFKSITLQSEDLYFDFYKDNEINGSNILGLDLIKYLDSRIYMNVGKCYLSISEPNDFDRRVINNKRTSKTDKILLSDNEIEALLDDSETTNQGFDIPTIGF